MPDPNVQKLDNTIRPGDLVMITRPASCCGYIGELFGVPFKVDAILPEPRRKHYNCNKRTPGPLVSKVGNKHFRAHILQLTKIHPLGREEPTMDHLPLEHIHD